MECLFDNPFDILMADDFNDVGMMKECLCTDNCTIFMHGDKYELPPEE